MTTIVGCVSALGDSTGIARFEQSDARSWLSATRHALHLSAPVELVDELVRLPPVFAHLHEELKKYSFLEHLFELQASSSANLFQHLAAFSDQDPFLPVALAINYGGDASYSCSFLKLLDHHGGCGWGLFLPRHPHPFP